MDTHDMRLYSLVTASLILLNSSLSKKFLRRFVPFSGWVFCRGGVSVRMIVCARWDKVHTGMSVALAM